MCVKFNVRFKNVHVSETDVEVREVCSTKRLANHVDVVNVLTSTVGGTGAKGVTSTFAEGCPRNAT